MNDSRPILVTGATGYVGGRLIPRLLEAGYHIRAVGRSMAKLNSRPWSRDERVEVLEGDVLNEIFLNKAANGCRAAYYLVHSMSTSLKDFEILDRKAAWNMVTAADKGGLEKIIYDVPAASVQLFKTLAAILGERLIRSYAIDFATVGEEAYTSAGTRQVMDVTETELEA